ncbi:MAG TPA: phenylalanine--tRNA ligase subunit beta, partial [bacterium]|nr:phenylalanine--tRNA ligase subunit beta [bacterium]
MLLSLNWLNEFIPHGLSVEELADALTMSGTEVKSIRQVGSEFDGVVVGEIIAIDPHPNADKLRLPTVRLGPQTTMQVVCGAPNLLVGAKIAFARPGARLFMDAQQKERIELTPATIRGVKSEGMVCSERELGLGQQHYEGIVILDTDAVPGTSFAEALALHDTIFDLEITPNRGDCLSVLGIAREVAACTGKKVRLPFRTGSRKGYLPADFTDELTDWVKQAKKQDSGVTIELRAPELCPWYSALVVSNLAVTQSPLWMRWRLENVGVRAINNIVDVTNYVMLEVGEPQHAFDRRFIQNDTIIVRRAKQGESIVTLDGQKRDLSHSMLLIADSEKGVALAGIMGGANSEIADDTTDLILEAAHFDPVCIRKASTALAHRTEGSARWEKFVDPELRLLSLYRAFQLMGLTCPDARIAALIDACLSQPGIRVAEPGEYTRRAFENGKLDLA